MDAAKSKAGRIGGKSRSPAKIRACRANGLNSRLLPPGVAARNRVLKNHTEGAKTRGLVWGITEELFDRLIRSDCHYCGVSPSSIMKAVGGNLTYNGIDRKNNTLGYLPDNVVPCCKTCNWAKGKKSYEEFMEYLRRVVNFWRTANERTV